MGGTAPGAANGKRRKVMNAVDLGESGAGGELQESDLDIVSEFEKRFEVLKVVEPPVADAPFKTHLSASITKLGALKADMKAKRRSAIRRTEKENDPLAISLQELTCKADNLLHILK